MKGAEVVELPLVGHGFSRPQHWAAQFDEAVKHIRETLITAAPPSPAVPQQRELEATLRSLDLPLSFAWPSSIQSFLIFFSGDGGWASLDQALADGLKDRGVATIGWSSLRYFWHEKTADQINGDLNGILAALKPYGVPIYAGGYSFGAEVLPVALQHGPPDVRKSLAGLLLVGPGPNATFEINPLDWVRASEKSRENRVDAAVAALSPLETVCVSGAEDDETICRELAKLGNAETVLLPGAHHFAGEYDRLVDAAADHLLRPRR